MRNSPAAAATKVRSTLHPVFEPTSNPLAAGRPADPRSNEFPPAGQPPLALPEGHEYVPGGPGRGYAVTSLVFSALTTFLPPAVVFAAGFGVAAKNKNDPWAHRALIIAGVCLAIGILVTLMAMSLDDRNLLFTGL